MCAHTHRRLDDCTRVETSTSRLISRLVFGRREGEFDAAASDGIMQFRKIN